MTDTEKDTVLYGYGDEAYEEELERQKQIAKEREAKRVANVKVYPVWLKEGENKNFVFLHTRPAWYSAHDVKYSKKFGGEYREVFGSIPCTMKSKGECVKCEEEDIPKTKVIYIVLDLTPYEVDGVTYTAGTIRPFIRPFNDAARMKRMFDGSMSESNTVITDETVSSKVMRVIRDGTGVSTTYSYIPAFQVKLTDEQKKRIKDFQEKYPNVEEFIGKWLENNYVEMMQELGYVPKPEIVDADDKENSVVGENELPF